MAKICMVAFTHYLFDSRPRREAEALVDRGDEVDFISLRKPGEKKIETINGVRLLRLSIPRYRGSNTTRYLTTYLLFFIRAFLEISTLHIKRRYDIIQAHTMPDFIVFATLIPKMLGAKVILDVHDLMPELYMSKFRMDDTKRLIRFITWIEKRSIDFAHKAIAVHKPQLDILLKHGNSEEKFIILLNVPDPKIFVSHNNVEPVFNKKFRLIYHGTIAMRHGIDVALHAIAQALKEIPHLEFQIVGEGDDLERVVAMANGLKLSNCVQFSDKAIPLDLIPSMIDQADVGIVPMLNDQFTRHTLPVKLLEYVLMGKPVIASRIEGLEAYFDDTMISYFKPGDTVDLADRIVDLYRHPEKARQFVSNSNRFNEEFNWQSQKKLYYNLIDSLLQA